MPFFIKGKRKNESNARTKSKENEKVRLGAQGVNHKKRKIEDEEISSDSEVDDLKLDNEYSHSSDSEIEETAQEKRLRLARKYLEEVEKEEKKRLETDEVDRDVIAQRLKEDILERAGKLRKTIADTIVGHGEFAALTSSDDFNIVRWSLMDRKKTHVVKRTNSNGHKRKILALAVSSDNKFLASGDQSGKLNIWNPEDLTLIHSFTGHRTCITGLAFRKNTHQLFSSSTDKTVKIWNLDEMMYVETLYGHLNSITSIDALVRDRAITSGGADSSIRIWKVPEESHLILNGHKESIDCVKLINEEFFISGGDGGHVCLWNSMKKKPLFTLKDAHGRNPDNDSPNWIISIGTCLYTDLFASGSYNGTVNVYKLNERERSFDKLMEIKLEGNVNCLAFTSDAKYLIAGIGREHRLGRWHTIKSVKNRIVLIPLTKKED